MAERPNDPWPRGTGHVVLAMPGSREDFKAYHEPGGSFSPAFASFGISLWVGDANGKLIATSDSIPIDELTQKFAWKKSDAMPSLRTETKFYSATWSAAGHGKWKLEVDPKISEDQRLMLVVRSVGPAGAAIQSVGWESKPLRQKLAINDRWVLTFNRAIASFDVAAPAGTAHLTATAFKEIEWQSDEKWGFARFNLPSAKITEISVVDFAPGSPSTLKFERLLPPLKVKLPDATFVDCLQAQVAHLMMGLVGNETRPGEPNNYPVNWLRDGAYVIVALARSGQLDVARQLVVPFAENDFFGGFGAEADAPGLALWCIEEVAGLSKDRKFDSFLWPHVERKVALLEEMLTARQPVRKPFTGPIVPAHRNRNDLDLICDAAKDGLIQGRMDWHRPVLYVNAVAYRGLVNAATLARRTGHGPEADAWLREAAELRAAWNKAFASGQHGNERNYICALYPTFVATDPKSFDVALTKYLAGTHDASGDIKGTPLWTYFNVAHAHQWLVLGQPENMWKDLRWFMSHQASPGLFTWWEGSSEENNFGRWETMVRGWTKPPHVTPHYWTAAEMLLLQLDALAFVDETIDPVLVIGAGIPESWLEKPLSVEGVGTRFGKVDWEWRQGKLTVAQHGFKMAVKAGSSFPADTAIRIKR